MSFITPCPYQETGMVADPQDGADNVVDKDVTLQGPVCRPLEAAIGISRNPEILPDQHAITIRRLIEVVGLAESSSPDPHHIDICIPAKVKFLVISDGVAVEH